VVLAVVLRALPRAGDDRVEDLDVLGSQFQIEPVSQPWRSGRSARRRRAILVRLARRARLSVDEKVDGTPVLREQQPHGAEYACGTPNTRDGGWIADRFGVVVVDSHA
jgi:hypothetical protein